MPIFTLRGRKKDDDDDDVDEKEKPSDSVESASSRSDSSTAPEPESGMVSSLLTRLGAWTGVSSDAPGVPEQGETHTAAPVLTAEEIRLRRLQRFATAPSDSCDGTSGSNGGSSDPARGGDLKAEDGDRVPSTVVAAFGTEQSPDDFISLSKGASLNEKLSSRKQPENSSVSPEMVGRRAYVEPEGKPETRAAPKKTPQLRVDEEIGRILRFRWHATPDRDWIDMSGAIESFRTLNDREGEGTGVSITTDNLDGLMNSVLPLVAPQLGISVFQHLCRSFERLHGTSEFVKKQNVDLFDLLKSLLVSYAGLVVQFPDLFPDNPGKTKASGAEQLLNIIFGGGEDAPAGWGLAFLDGMTYRFAGEDDRETLKAIFEPCFVLLTMLMRRTSFGPSQMSPFAVLRTVSALMSCAWKNGVRTSFPVAELLVTAPIFQVPENGNGKAVENTLLGAVLKNSPLELAVRQGGSSSSAVLRQSQLLDTVCAFVTSLLKMGGRIREGMMKWIADAIRLNEFKGKLQADFEVSKETASDGLMFNLAGLCVGLCIPFVTKNKFSLVDARFVLKPHRCSFAGLSTMVATEGRKEDPEKEYHFVTEIFFLTLMAIHEGIANLARVVQESKRRIAHFEEQLRRMKAELETSQTPRGMAMLKFGEEKVQEEKERMTAIRAAFAERNFASGLHSFHMFTAEWLERVLDGSVKEVWEHIPDPFLENLVNIEVLLVGSEPRLVIQDKYEFVQIVRLSTRLVGSSEIVHNPFVRSKLGSLLFLFVSLTRSDPTVVASPHPYFVPLFDDSIVQERLGPALVNLFLNVEQTGSHTQFFDKLSIRYEITGVLEYLWTLHSHRKAILGALADQQLFLSFANVILNDSTFLLDDSFSYLQELHTLSNTGSNPDRMQELERMIPTMCLLSTTMVNLCSLLAEELPAQFVRPELADRVATMVTYFLKWLISDRSNLVVKNPEKFFFRPKVLLGGIVSIFIYLGNEDTFIAAVSHDGRSFSKGLMEDALSVLRSLVGSGYMFEMKLESFEKVVRRILEKAEEEVQEEEELGEIPDEFLDPIMQTLMRDPVVLPSSGQTMDRDVIARHLLSDPIDPYNRSPLTIDQVVPNDELRKRINAWVEEKKKKKG